MGRAVLVTGSSRGIGRAVAVALAADGAELVGVHYADNADAARETAELVEKAGARPVLLSAAFGSGGPDVATQLATSFLDAAQEALGERRIDVLVNNAAVGSGQPLGQIDEATFRRLVEINLTVPLFLTQALAPHLASGGRVVNISSGFTRVAGPNDPVYAATKGAINTLTLALAPTLAGRGATINAVMPGVTDTDANAGWFSMPGARDMAAGMSAFNRIGTPDDVADAVRFLASEQARWITGQVVDVSGGTRL